jgi:hypothetical protein
LTTSSFLDYLFDETLRFPPEQADAVLFLRNVIGVVQKQGLDVEDVLATLEKRAAFLDYLMADPEFQRDVLLGGVQQALRYRARDVAARDFIYDRVIQHYGAIDAKKAADLYRGLFAHIDTWTEQAAGGVLRTLPFFTLNYDRAVEAACSALGVPCVDGIAPVQGETERRWVRTTFHMYHEDPTHLSVVLVKLHGSVRLGRRAMARYGLGEDELVELPEGLQRDPQPYSHAVIYPTRNPKELTDEPFYTQYRVFNSCLQRAALLVVIGSSLRDPDVLIALRTALEDNARLRVLIVDPAANHIEVAGRIHVSPDVIAVERRLFAVEDAATIKRGASAFMATIRGYLAVAVGTSDMHSAFRFGTTREGPDLPGAFPVT